MLGNENHACVLFARSGSKGVPNKNRHVFSIGVSSYELPLLSAVKCTSNTFVCTDDSIIVEKAVELGAHVLPRPLSLATDEALLQDVIEYVYKLELHKFEFVTLLLANAPFVTPELIQISLERLKNDSSLDSVVTATRMPMFAPERAKKMLNNKLVPYLAQMNDVDCSRSSHSGALFPNGGLTTVRSELLRDMENNTPPLKWMGKNIGYIEQTGGVCDIDEPWQIPVVDLWLQKNSFLTKKL
jgi:CMP-N-acetylneuraminic acid synthetase